MTIVSLKDAGAEELYGGKAASLARAIGAGLPVPDGFAIPWQRVEDEQAIVAAWRALGAPRVAVRSSAIGEDSAEASFAGQHATILNVSSEEALLDAVREIRASAHADAAIEYRMRMGVAGVPRIAVVVQRMVDSESAGVMFTRNPLTAANERVIESAWGFGEAVVSGEVTPDRFRVTVDGVIVERTHSPEWEALSLTDPQLLALHRLAMRCEAYAGAPQDVEWAFAHGELWLLQSRPITTHPVPRGSSGSSGSSELLGSLPPEEPEEPRNPRNPPPLSRRRFAGLALAALLAPLNSTIIAVALPSIAGDFQSSPATVARWLVTGYLVVSIVAQSPAGKLADLWGHSRVLTLGRGLYGLGALLAAFSPALSFLGAGRVLMALGGALSIPTVFAQLRNSVPPSRRGRIFGIFGAIMGGAAAVGPILGGFLTARFGWHSVFVVNLPVVLLSLVLEPPARGAAERPAAKTGRFDVLGSVLLGVTVLLLVAGVEGRPLFALGGAVVLVAFIARELRTADPVLDVRLFGRRAFAAGSSIVALQNLAMYSMLFLLPFYLAGGDAARTGGMLLLFTAAMVLASPVGGRLSDAVGARGVAFTGGLIATAGAALVVAQGNLMAALVLMGIGIGISTSPSQAAALSAVSASEAGVASGALSTMRYLGGVIGGGLVALLAAGNLATDRRMLVFPIVLLASAAVALWLPGRATSR